MEDESRVTCCTLMCRRPFTCKNEMDTLQWYEDYKDLHLRTYLKQPLFDGLRIKMGEP